jgi:hypothetical protein
MTHYINEFDAQTGQEVLRPMTEEELAQKEIEDSFTPTPEITPLPENEHLISAMVKLQSLGLTTDEAKAIVGL